MNELLDTLKFLSELNLPRLYDLLGTELNSLANAGKKIPDDLSDASNNLVDALRKSEPVDWTASQRRFLQQIGAAEFIGEAAARSVEAALMRGRHAPSKSAEDIQAMGHRLNSFIERSKTALGLLAGIDRDRPTRPGPGQGRIELTFRHDVAITNFKELEQEAKRWDRTFKAIARLSAAPHESEAIVDARRGSLVLVLIAASQVAIALIEMVKGVVEIRQSLLEGTEATYRLRALNLPAAEKTAEEELQQKQDAAHAKLVEDLSRELVEGEVPPGEAKTAVREALEKIEDFIARGGNVEIALNGAKAADAVAALVESQRKLELLERQLAQTKRLNAAPDTPPEEE